MTRLNAETYERQAIVIKEMNIQLLSLQDLIDTSKEVGIDTSEMQAKAQKLKKTIDNWTVVLTNKGYMGPEVK